MKKFRLLLLVMVVGFHTEAQKNNADSLLKLLAKEKNDSNKATLLWNIGLATVNYNPDTALYFSQEALSLAEKIKFVEGESRALGMIANTFLIIGNYPKALEYYLKKLKIEEQRDNPESLASVTMNIGIVYLYQEQYRKTLNYYFKAKELIDKYRLASLKNNITLNLGDVYYRINNNDSAFIYFNESLSIATANEDGNFIGASMVGLGHVYLNKGNDSLASLYYHEAIENLKIANNEELLCEAQLGLAKLYQKMNRNDSAEFYALHTLSLSKKDGFLSWQLQATDFLKDHFKMIHKPDSALQYLEEARMLQDSISSKERVRESQILSSNEQIRQLEMEAKKQLAIEERNKQLQFLFIGIFIPGLFLFTLFLSRIRVHVRFIKLLGVLSLLILFEYLTLLLHPYVLEITHHKPVFEIMVFVAIAAILIPSHHRIEHWLIEKLTLRKNQPGKPIRIRTVKLKSKKPSN